MALIMCEKSADILTACTTSNAECCDQMDM